ncbi:hypothetical protein ACJMK2_040700 [Sinanodonta woodiana]|uniref:Protein kinase domain-containing protein n=1 Tax=Sinanodonta woodiana TaxID=1069815 RepID=A0ABD3W1X3_SINWO
MEAVRVVDDEEEDIDGLNLPQAGKKAKEHDIDIKRVKSVDEIRFLLKHKLLCQDKPRENIEKSLSRFAEVNKQTSDGLCLIFEDTLRKAEKLVLMKDPVVEEINNNIPNFCDQIQQHRERLKHSKCPVLVLGETGAGKSSFINLLLGQNILPCSLLSNTHIICQIMYNSGARQAYAVIHSTGSCDPVKVEQAEDDVNMDAFCSELANFIESIDANTGKPIYNKAEIFLDNDLLKSGLVIVDSPGIGDTQEMTNLVLDFILEAYTFIYLINSTNAGGVQQRLQELMQKVYRKALEEQKIYRSECALFICNKWDEVPVKERQKVWDDTIDKLKKCWPNFEVTQVYRMSTKEALHMQENKRCITPRFAKVMDSIGNLLPLGQDILVMRSFRFLLHFVDKCIHIFDSHLHQVQLSLDEWKKQYTDTKERLGVLVLDIDSFFDAQKKDLDKKIGHIAIDLREYLHEKKTLDALCSFGSGDIPSLSADCDAAKWEAVTVEVRNAIYDRLMKAIEEWESKASPFRQIGKEIEESLKTEFPKFQFQLLNIENDLAAGRKMSVSLDDQELQMSENVEDEPFIPNFISQKFLGTTLGTKIAVGIGLSPVLLVGAIVLLPVWGAKLLKRAFDHQILERSFLDAKDEDARNLVVRKYALKVVESMTKEFDLENVIKEDLEPIFNYLCTVKSQMKNQIEIDRCALKRLNEEKRDKDEIVHLYEPLKQMLVFQRNHLKQFQTLYLPKREGCQEILLKNLLISDTVVCSGLVAEILCGEITDPNCFSDVSVRRVRRMPSPNTISKFLEAEVAYRYIKQESIVQCKWMARGEGAAYQVLEPLKYSLSVYSQYLKEAIRQHPFENCWPIVKQVIDGLIYLHDRNNVLYDLSLDTVAVNLCGKVVITNISADVKVDIQRDMRSKQFNIYKYFCICPELLASSPVRYQKIHDIYSLGVLMWEIWTCMRVYEQDSIRSISHSLNGGQMDSASLYSSLSQAEESTSDTDGNLLNIDNIKSLIKEFQPRREPWFIGRDFFTADARHVKWWNIIDDCLAMKPSPKNLVKEMENI